MVKIRLLDTREQKSPRFITKEFETIPATLDAGDMMIGNPFEKQFIGYGIEFKLSLSDQQNGDYGIHTEPIERFHDECANKIQPFMIANPKCDFHAIWWVERKVSNHEKELWDHYCYQYLVWGHVVHSKDEFIAMIKKIESGFYVRDASFIKRSHEEPTDLAKCLRVPNGVSSQIAIDLSKCESYDAVMEIKGMQLKNGERSKLFKKIYSFLAEIEDFYNTKFLGTGEQP